MPPAPAARGDVRILIIEDHALFAESLDLALSVEGYDVKRAPMPENGGGSPASLLLTVVQLKPRIVLLDLDLGYLGDGVQLIEPITRSGAHVVVVTASSERSRMGECLHYGARKVVTKNQPLNQILATVRRINEGLPVMERTERDELLRHWNRERAENLELRSRLDRLTAREREVLGELMKGRTVHDVARRSVVSEATVRTQVKSILGKLEVSSQLAAVGLAHRVHWHPPTE